MTIQETVHQIHELFRRDEADEADVAKLRDLAGSLRSGAELLQNKLGVCRPLWQAGRHDEARQLARRGEDLREGLRQLEFDERDDWLDLCADRELPIPDELDDGGLVAELYGRAAEYELLLRRHRKLAIGRAPVIDRVRILRKLTQLKPEQVHWKDDARDLEKLRLEELQRAARVAKKEGKLEVLEAVLAELSSSDWIGHPSKKLIEQVDKAAQPLRNVSAAEGFADLVDPIRDAHGAFEEEACRDLLARWDAVREQTKCEPKLSLAEEVAPAQEWVADLDKQRQDAKDYDEACAALRLGLDDEVDLPSLERLVGKVLRHERGMPQVLSARTHSRLEDLRRQGKRRFALVFSAIAAVTLIVGGTVTVGARYVFHKRDVSRWHDQIMVELERDNLAGAGGLLEKLQADDMSVFEAPDIQRLLQQHKDAVGAEQARQAGFNSALAAVEQVGVAAPEFERLLAKAKDLAVTLGEQEAVQDWRHKRTLHRDGLKAQTRTKWRKRLNGLEGEFSRLRRAFQSQDADGFTKRLPTVLAEASTIGEQADGAISRRAEAIAVSTRDMRDRSEGLARRGRKVNEALASIADLAYDPKGLIRELTNFSASFPDHALASQFLRATNMAPQWRAAQAWVKLVGPWNGSPRVKNAAQASVRLSDLQDYTRTHPSGPDAETAKAWMRYLSTAREAWSGRALKGASTVSRVLGNPLISASYTFKDDEGRTYYLRTQKVKTSPRGNDTEVTFTHYVDARLRTRSTTLRVRGKITAPQRSPQSNFAASAFKLFQEADSGWETLYLRLAHLAAKNKAMDPILSATLVRLFLQYARDTTPFVDAELRGLGRELQTLDLNVAWMRPDDAMARSTRPRVAAALGRFQDPTPLIKKVEAALAQKPVIRPTGVWLPGRPFKLALEVKNAKLFVLKPTTTGGTRFHPIGKVVWRKTTLDSAQTDALSGGTLVFSGGKP